MRRNCGITLVAATLLSPATSRAELIGVAWDPNDSQVYRIDERTGAAAFVGNSGIAKLNSLALSPDGVLYSVGGTGSLNDPVNILVRINPATGRATRVRTLSFGSREGDVRALAFAPDGTLFAENEGSIGGGTGPFELFRINIATGIGTRVGDTGDGVVGMDFATDGTLYGYNNNRVRDSQNVPGLGLVRIDPATGALTDVNAATVGLDIQSVVFGTDGTLYGARDKLWTIDPEADTA